MEIQQSSGGVKEIATNARLVLVLTMALASFEQFLLVSGNDAVASVLLVRLSLGALLVGSLAGIGVLLKQPFSTERVAGLDAQVHRGLNLFYGAELGGLAVGFLVFCLVIVFGDYNSASAIVR